MLYDLSKPIDRERFQRRCKTLFENGRKVELTERTKRSCAQNRYLHLIIGYLAMEVGVSIDYAKEHYYKRMANAPIFCYYEDDPIVKIQTERLKSSASLSVEEMALSIDRFRHWSSQVAGIYLPEAHEQEFLEEIEREIQRHKEYL